MWRHHVPKELFKPGKQQKNEWWISGWEWGQQLLLSCPLASLNSVYSTCDYALPWSCCSIRRVQHKQCLQVRLSCSLPTETQALLTPFLRRALHLMCPFSSAASSSSCLTSSSFYNMSLPSQCIGKCAHCHTFQANLINVPRKINCPPKKSDSSKQMQIQVCVSSIDVTLKSFFFSFTWWCPQKQVSDHKVFFVLEH